MSARDDSAGYGADLGPSSNLGDFDIPPAIACALCGNHDCEGCTPSEPDPAPPPTSPQALPWEDSGGGWIDKMLETSEISATRPQIAFGHLQRGSISRALTFAFLCELWAVASFTALWALGFYAAFPFVARQMLGSPVVVSLIGAILFGLIAFVVFVHALWGIGLEWGIARAGGTADMNRGIRFGLYACGWDLLTSPAGAWFMWRRAGLRNGFAHLRAATKAPRISVRAYLDDCRNATERQRKSAVWTSIWLGLGGVGGAGLILFLGLLLAWLPWIFY